MATQQDIPLSFAVLDYTPWALPAPTVCGICNQAFQDDSIIAWVYCTHHIHLTCANNRYAQNPAGQPMPCHQEGCPSSILPPPHNGVLQNFTNESRTCMKCDVDQFRPGYGDFFVLECDEHHTLHVTCALSILYAHGRAGNMTLSNLRAWKNIPCPMCSVPIDVFSFSRLTRLTAPANHNRPMIVVEYERHLHQSRTRRIQTAYDVLAPEFNDVKDAAKTAFGQESNHIIFTAGMSCTPRSANEIRHYQIEYFPSENYFPIQNSRSSYRYTIAAWNKETFGAVGQAWLRVVWDTETLDIKEYIPLFWRGRDRLEWGSAIDELEEAGRLPDLTSFAFGPGALGMLGEEV